MARIEKTRVTLMAAMVLVLAATFAPTLRAAEIELKGITPWPKGYYWTGPFFEFQEMVAQRLGGKLKIKYLGGKEVVPTFKQFEGLRNGVVDVILGAASYYTGQVPEATAVLYTRIPPSGLRKNGYYDLMRKIHLDKGNVIYLEELLDEARNRARDYMSANVDKRPELEDEEAVAEAVGIAAIFFSDLSKQRIKDYNFSWERAISFEGDTGPYLMNAHARIAGIIRKCGIEVDPEADVSLLQEPSAHNLVSLVSRYTEALREAARTYEPSILAAYLLDLARALHSSYKELRVKGEEEKLAGARLLLFAVVKNILAGGMKILGIRPLEKM